MISKNLRPSGWELQPGDVALFDLLGKYEAKNPGRHGHSLSNIERILSHCEPPPEYVNDAGLTAFGVFAGYLALDALIANQDRHEQNWAILRPRLGDDGARLCGSFDHASSLGFNLRDSMRAQRLIAGTVADWALRGTAQRFEHSDGNKIETLVELTGRALGIAGSAARTHWLDNISRFGEASMATLIEQIPSMSDPSRRFAIEVLRTNRRRLLNEC